jgi:hypothetical protein
MSRPWSLLLALAFLSTPLKAAIQPGPENVLVLPAFGSATGYPLLASNGNGFLAAWSGDNSTFVLPLSPSGEPLREKAVPIHEPTRQQRILQDMASDGDHYVVANSTDVAIVTTAADNSGRVIATTTVAKSAPYAAVARLAWNGEKYLLAYTPDIATGAIMGVFLNHDGVPVGDPFTIVAKRNSPSFSLASNGKDFLIALTSYDVCQENACRIGLFTEAIFANGTAGPLLTLGPVVQPTITPHGLAFTGARYVFAWSDSLGDFRSVNEVTLDQTGAPERPSTIVTTGTVSAATLALSVVRTPDGAVAFTQSGDKTRATRIDLAGNVLDAQPVDVFDELHPTYAPVAFDAASSGSSLFAVWSHFDPPVNGSSSPPILVGSQVDFSRSQSGRALAKAAIDRTVLDLASSDRTELVLSMTNLTGTQPFSVDGQRVVDGVPAGDAFVLFRSQFVGPTTSIATHGSDFLVVASEFDGGGTNAIRAHLLRNGLPPAKDVELGRGSDSPFAIWTGDHYLVLWTERTFSNESGFDENLLVRRLAANGDALDAAPREVVAAPGFRTAYARVVSTPAGLVAVYQHGTPEFFRGTPILSYDVYVSRISADGDFIGDPVPISSTNGETESALHLAVDPNGNILVTWVAYPNDYHLTSHARGVVVNNALSVVRTLDFGDVVPHSVAWSGSAFLVSWVFDQEYTRRYSSAGESISDPIALTTDTASKGTPWIVPAPGGAFVAYTRPMPETNGSDAQIIVGRMILDTERRRAVAPR